MKNLFRILAVVLTISVLTSCGKEEKVEAVKDTKVEQEKQMQLAFESVYHNESWDLRDDVILEAVRLKENGYESLYACWLPAGVEVNFSAGGSLLTGKLTKKVFAIKTKDFYQTKDGRIAVKNEPVVKQVQLKVVKTPEEMTGTQAEPYVLASEVSLYNEYGVIFNLEHFIEDKEFGPFHFNPDVKCAAVFDGFIYIIGKDGKIYKPRYQSMIDRNEKPGKNVIKRPVKL